ncbi:60s acidic ribosomal protein-domain-containing protein [Cladochytrium replicatum]|nr:60s acidic ribosomal protein-domain-containing protein [Cladochytrium replicatum]
MKYLAAFLLAQLAGNDAPSSKDVTKILSAVGIEADDDQLDNLLSKLAGKDVNELISDGASKLAALPAGGAVSAAPVAAAPAAGGVAPAAEKKEEKKKEEVKEESDDDMGFGLFD